MLQKLSDIAKNRFTATATAGLATVALLTPGVFNQQAHADQAPKAPQASCAPLVVENGRERSADYSAHNFSTKKKGNVGISIYAGSEFDGAQYTPDQIGRYLVNKVEAGNLLDAECFISPKKSPNGTSIAFTVNGIDVPKDENGLNLTKALDEQTIAMVRGEANLVQVSSVDYDKQDPAVTLAYTNP